MGIGFADDVNLLAYSQSTEENCRKLERAHQEMLQWARKHGMRFAPQKYKLIHFSRKTKRFNMQASIQIGEIEKSPSQSVRVLGVQVDPKLKWTAH